MCYKPNSTTCKLRVMRCKPNSTTCNFRVMRCKPNFTTCKLCTMSCKPNFTTCNLRALREKPPELCGKNTTNTSAKICAICEPYNKQKPPQHLRAPPLRTPRKTSRALR